MLANPLARLRRFATIRSDIVEEVTGITMLEASDIAALPFSAQRQIDLVCDRFERDWHLDRAAPIESYLAEVPHELRDNLTSELIQLETECVRQTGQSPPLDQYLARFPHLAAEIDRLFCQTATVQLPTSTHTNDQPRDDVIRQIPEVGRSWGRFLILEKLGDGSIGSVFSVQDSKLERTLVLKVLRAEFASKATVRRRFERASQTLVSLTHDNVLRVEECGHHSDLPYVTMERLSGETLRRRLFRSTPLTARELCQVGQQVAGGLQAAHRMSLVHGHLQPENVWLIDGVLSVKVLDFGLSGPPATASSSTPASGLACPHFLAPEHFQDAPVDFRSDLFSLGSLLYTSATGRRPFEGATWMSVRRAIAGSPHPPVLQINPLIPSELVQLIDGLLEKQPHRRPASAADVGQRLEEILSRLNS